MEARLCREDNHRSRMSSDHAEVHGREGERHMNHLPSLVACVVGWRPVQNWAIGFVEDSSTGNWKHTARRSNYLVSLWSQQGRTLATTRIVIAGGFTAFLASCDCAEGREDGGMLRLDATETVSAMADCWKRGEGRGKIGSS